MTGVRFVSIPRDALMSDLVDIGEKIAGAGGSFEVGSQGREVVIDYYPPGAKCSIRVYTTLSVGSSEVRESGSDAVRIVLGARLDVGFRALEEPDKILRTAPQGVGSDERVQLFLGRLRDRIRRTYALAVRRPSCPLCGRPMARRHSDGRAFFGCTGYPVCRGTVPAT